MTTPKHFWKLMTLCLLLTPISYLLFMGKEALHELAASGQGRVIQILVSLGYDIDAVNRFGCTPLLTAVHQGDDPTIVDTLVALGAIPDFTSENCGPAVYDAVVSEKKDMLAHLLSAGADPDQAGPNGETPLTLAASRGEPVIVYALLMAGADPKLPDADGNGPLHRLFAGEVAGVTDCRLNLIDETVVIAKNLINKGADLSDENRDGESAETLAKAVCAGEVLKALAP